jgi:hypothetical protein
MKASVYILLLFCSFFTLDVFGTDEKAGWVSLFDGKTLNGWKANIKKADVKVVDGEIHMLSKKGNLWLVHNKDYEDFELEVEAFMPSDDYNSGIAFRCTNKGKKPIGFQCEVWAQKSGSIYGIGKGYVLPEGAKDWAAFYKTAGDCFKAGQWNKFRIKCEGSKIQIWINGHQTADVESKLFTKGVFALQHHGRGGVHRFRNIRIKTLK